MLISETIRTINHNEFQQSTTEQRTAVQYGQIDGENKKNGGKDNGRKELHILLQHF